MQESCIKQIIFRIGISSRWDSHIANEKRIKNSLFVCVRYPAPCFSLSLAPPAPTTWGALFSAFRSVFTFSIIFGFFVSAGRARPTRLKICLMLVSFVPAFCFFYYPLALSYFGHRFWGVFFPSLPTILRHRKWCVGNHYFSRSFAPPPSSTPPPFALFIPLELFFVPIVRVWRF